MNSTLNTKLLLFISIFITSIHAQNLQHYIPGDAQAVVEINVDQIFNLIDVTDLAGLIPSSPSGEPSDLSEYGISLTSKAYYFYRKGDSIGSQNLILPLADAQKAGDFISSMVFADATSLDGYQYIQDEGKTAAWNDNMAILTSIDFPKKVYTLEELIAEKEEEKMQLQDSLGYDNTEGTEDMEDDSLDDYSYGQYEQDDSENLEFELMIKNMSAPFVHTEEEMQSILQDNFRSIAQTLLPQSVLQHPSYMAGKKDNASVYFWMKNLDEHISNVAMKGLADELPMGDLLDKMPSVTGITSLTSNLTFDKDEIRIESLMGSMPELVESYGKIYGGKIDKSFLNYFDKDDAIAYMSFKSDMSSWVKEFPSILESQYGAVATDYKEELDLAIDLIDVLLDEEEIGKLITGDGLLILHNVEEQEVTFTTTEYDDDFNPIEVEKTEMQPTPIFSFMLGSENKSFFSKLMRIAKKYGFVTPEKSHYLLPISDMGSPFDVYAIQNDGIVYVSNSLSKINNFSTGKKMRNLGKHRKTIRNNPFNLYLNLPAGIDNLNKVFPLGEENTGIAKNNFKELQIASKNLVDGKYPFDIVIKTSDDYDNTLKLIFDTINKTMMGI